MEQISNKTLTVLLIAAIVVSVGGTIISINRINRLSQARLITGMAGTGTGYVNVSIAAVASISVLEGQIDFGSCSPNASIGANLSSNDSSGSWGSPGVCQNGNEPGPDNITIHNDGNTYINVTVNSSTLASSLIGGGSVAGKWQPGFLFMTRNATSGTFGGTTSGPGCLNRTGAGTCVAPDGGGGGGLQWGWKNFSNDGPYCACDNLTPQKGIFLFARLNVPEDATSGQGEQRATLTLTANEI